MTWPLTEAYLGMQHWIGPLAVGWFLGMHGCLALQAVRLDAQASPTGPEHVSPAQPPTRHPTQQPARIAEKSLGRLHVPLELRWKSHLPPARYELIRVAPQQVVRSGSVGAGTSLILEGLPPTDYRLRFWIRSPVMAGPNWTEAQPLILDSGPFRVEPLATRGATQIAPISIRSALQAVKVFGEFRGQRFLLEPFEVFLTMPNHPEVPFFLIESPQYGDDPRLARWNHIWVPKDSPLRFAAVAQLWIQPGGSPQERFPLRGGPVAWNPGDTSLVISMQVIRPRVTTLHLGRESRSAIAPFRLQANWSPYRVVAKNGHAWVNAHLYSLMMGKGPPTRCTPEGTIELPGTWAARLEFLNLSLSFDLVDPDPRAQRPPPAGTYAQGPLMLSRYSQIRLIRPANTLDPGGTWVHHLSGPLPSHAYLPVPLASLLQARHGLMHPNPGSVR